MATEPKLYEIGAELEALVDQLIEAEGELSPELEKRLDAARGEFAIKAERVICAIRSAEARAEMVKREIDRLHELAKPYVNTAQSLRNYLYGQMKRTGRIKVNMPRGKAWVQRNSRPAIRYVGRDEQRLSDVPDQFVRVSYTPDGAALYEAWKKNELPIMFDAEIGEHLRVR